MADGVKISSLDLVTSTNSADSVPIVQSGVTKRVSPKNIYTDAEVLAKATAAAVITTTSGILGKRDSAGVLRNPQVTLNNGLICAPKANIPEYPDNVAGTTYIQDAWATADGWRWPSDGSTVPAVSNGTVLFAAGSQGLQRTMGTAPAIADPQGKTFRFKINITALGSSTVLTLGYIPSGGSPTTISARVAQLGNQIIDVTIPSGTAVTTVYFLVNSTCSGSMDFAYIGDGTYSSLALDASGNGNHGTVFGCTPVAGITGRALQFDGVNDRVVLPATADYPRSFTAILTIAQSGLAAQVILAKGLAGTDRYSIGRPIASNNLNVRYSDGVGGVVDCTFVSYFTTSLETVFVALSFNYTTRQISAYKNGVLFATQSYSASAVLPTNNSAPTLGSFPNATELLNGTIDDPRIYNRALSAGEIWELYQNPGGNCINDMVMASTPVANSISVRDSAGNISANGVRFPGAQSASTDANTLDDYEEGSWTPTLTFGGTEASYTTQNGNYTKIGNRVTFSAYIALSAVGAGTGDAVIGGLPFTCANETGASSPVTLSLFDVAFADTPQANVSQNAITIAMYEVLNNGTRTTLAHTDFKASTILRISGSYKVA
jgi:hypothetical protein